MSQTSLHVESTASFEFSSPISIHQLSCNGCGRATSATNSLTMFIFSDIFITLSLALSKMVAPFETKKTASRPVSKITLPLTRFLRIFICNQIWSINSDLLIKSQIINSRATRNYWHGCKYTITIPKWVHSPTYRIHKNSIWIIND